MPARIVAVADSFDAMTIDRPYRKARAPEAAHLEIMRLSGSQFDPDVVRAFQHAWDENVIQAVWESWYLVKSS